MEFYGNISIWFILDNGEGNMLFAGVKVIEHMLGVCSRDSIMTIFGDDDIDGFPKGSDNVIFKI